MNFLAQAKSYLEERLNNAELPQGQERADFKYSKKVVLDNGTTLIGNITHQDNYWLQIETKIGVLSVDVNSIVQIIDISNINRIIIFNYYTCRWTSFFYLSNY